MKEWKVLAIIAVFAAGFGLSITFGSLPTREPGTVNMTMRNRHLVVALRALTGEVELLRAEIGELRTVIANNGGLPPVTSIQGKEQDGPEVVFTQVPPSGQAADGQGNIAGTVTGLAAPEEYKIVIYAHTDQWSVQPFVNMPYTTVMDNGTWNNLTLSGNRYVALLVRPAFQPKATLVVLPEVGGDVIAKAEFAPQ